MEKESKVVVISGGMGDIGMGIATKLSAEGFRIFLIYHSTPKEIVDEFIKSLAGTGHGSVACDITNEKELKKSIEQIEKEAKRIDICIHSAVSPIVRKTAETISLSEFKEQFEVTTFGGLNFFQSVIPFIKKQKESRIIGITSSVLTSDRKSGMTGYLAAKMALTAVLKDLSFELKDNNITVNAIAPAFVKTKLHNDLPHEVLKFVSERSKVNSVEEVSETIAFLCSEGAAGITGKTYSVGNSEINPL